MNNYVDDFIIVTQSVIINLHGRAITQTVSINQNARTHKYEESVTQSLNLGHTVIKRSSIFSVNASNFIEFFGKGAPTKFAQVVQIVPLYDRARPVFVEEVESNLNLGQTVLGQNGKHSGNTLVVGQSMSLQWRRSITTTQTVNLGNFANNYQLDKYTYAIVLPDLNTPEC